LTDSPLKLAHIEEYRKQKAESDTQFSIDTSSLIYWRISIVAETPRGRYAAFELVSVGAFLRWRLKLAKRRLLKQWRIVCEMES
jgi:hypothetical protein